uniref:Uncharacterized protein n=1 Tax=Tolypothrix bouteillei VB521301 TaxID=1479485 RepID=A0A0C1N5Z2_9CYAN
MPYVDALCSNDSGSDRPFGGNEQGGDGSQDKDNGNSCDDTLCNAALFGDELYNSRNAWLVRSLLLIPHYLQVINIFVLQVKGDSSLLYQPVFVKAVAGFSFFDLSVLWLSQTPNNSAILKH